LFNKPILDTILKISDSEAKVKEEKSGGVTGGEAERGDDVSGLIEKTNEVWIFYL